MPRIKKFNRNSATDAVMCFNEGSIAKTNVFKLLGFQPGKFMVEGLRNIDNERIKRANIKVREGNKKKRVRRRLLKKKREESESTDYCPGGLQK
ncbi:hypothetical protein J6590_086382 [Homalodisca vitripennis]|nr:hypothetical protein J6590_086382 [Homalodisca vitripennis]